jgi:hypothetical protein
VHDAWGCSSGMGNAPPLGRCPTLLRHEADIHKFFRRPFGVFFGLVVPIRRTRASRAARALFGSTKSLGTGGVSPFPRTSPFCPGLDDDATFRSKSFLRSRLVRSLRGSTSNSTERPLEHTIPGGSEVARQDSGQPPSGGVDGIVAEESLEDWVDDFEAISLADVPGTLGVEGVGPTESVAGASGVSNTIYGEADTTSASSASQQSQQTKQSQAQVRSRTISKTSKRSRKSSRRNTELRLILDFPLPPTFIPTPTRSKPPQDINPVHDDGSIFYDRDPFRAEPIRDQETVAESASVNNPEADIARVASSASFYTAHSRSRSSTPSVHTDLPPSQPSVHPSSLPALQFPFPNPSSSPSPQTQTDTTSTTRRSIKTLTKASATLKRFGNLTRETLRTSFRKPIPELSVHRPRRATRITHASLDQLHQSSSQQAPDRGLLPDFQPEAFDISFPAVETPPRGSRVSRAHPSVQSFYASLEEFLTSHLHSDESNRRSRFLSAPTLLLTSERDPPKPAELPRTEIQVVPPTPPLCLPRPERPLPPLPREGYHFVDPSTLTESTSVTPATEYRYSPIPPSPSWLSRNVRELEIALTKQAKSSSASSSRSARGTDTEDVSTVHLPKAVQTQTPSSSTTSSSTRLRGEVVLLRGRVNIQDFKSSQITLRSLTSSNKSPSEATVVVRTRSRPRRNRSGQPQFVISAVPPNPPVRPRSRSSSVTKATITHYRRSLVETRKKCRPPRKEDTAKLCTGAKVSKARFIFSLWDSAIPTPFIHHQSRSYRLAVTNKPTVSRAPPLDIVPVCECGRLYLRGTC